MKKKYLATLLASGMILSSLVGCSNTEQADTQGETKQEGEVQKIVVATPRTDIVDTKLKGLAQQFMDENPGTLVEFEAFKDYNQIVSTRVAGGEAPDIYQVLETNMLSNVLDEYFLPIDDLGFSEENLYYYTNSKGVDGQVYALNDAISYEGIVYNKRAFEAAGITAIPQTIDEFYQVCEQLKTAGITPMTTALKDVWPTYPWCTWDSVQITLRGSATGANTYLEKDEIYDDAMLESLNIIRECYKKGYLETDVMSAGWDQLKLDLSQGKAAMHYTGSWFPSQVIELGANKEDIGMFPFPGAKGISVIKGKSWGVAKDSKNPELAKEFLAYMIEEGRYSKLAGDTPANKGITIENEAITELLSYGVEPIESEATKPEFGMLKNKIECNEQTFLQSYILESDEQKVQQAVEEWNSKWGEVRKSLDK